MAPEGRPSDSPMSAEHSMTPEQQAEACEYLPVSPEETFAAVEQILHDAPCEFQFFQAVRLLELLGRGRQPVGRFAHPQQEAVRFGTHNSFPFPASQIQKLDWPENEPPKMTVNFMGLTGPSGVLPLVYTELVVQRMRERDHTMAAFLDIFNHRMISFFYHAWEKYRFPVGYQRSRDDTFSRQLNSLLGIGTPGLEHRQKIDDDSLRFYTGLMTLQSRSASALRDILIDYFGVPVEIEQFVGSWYPLKDEDQCSFGDGFSLSEQLGIGSVVGDAVWDQQSKIRVKLGPMTMKEYQAFLPSGSEYRPMESLIRVFLNNEMDFEVQLILKRAEVPQTQLGAETGDGPPLGWTTWMKSSPGFERDPGDTLLRFGEDN